MQMLAVDSAAAVARSTDEHGVETATRIGLCIFHLSGCSWVLRRVRCIRDMTHALQHVCVFGTLSVRALPLQFAVLAQRLKSHVVLASIRERSLAPPPAARVCVCVCLARCQYERLLYNLLFWLRG